MKTDREVTHINRQQYLNELSRLLSFMFKEDRSEIIKQYNEMLDNAEDEEAMLRSFGSPTRLAVEISRSYNASGQDVAAIPEQIKPLAGKKQNAEPTPKTEAELKAEPEAPEEKKDTSYIDIIEEIRREKALEEGIEYTPIFFAEEETPVEEPQQEEKVSEEESPTDEIPEETAPEEEVSEENEPAAEAVEEPAEEPEEECNGKPESAPETEEDEPETAPEAEEESAPSEEPESTEELSAPVEMISGDDNGEDEPSEPDEELSVPERQTEKKTKVGLAILYAIPAIPIGVALLIVTVCVGLAIFVAGIAAVRIGVELVAFTFSGMTLFADIMICFGITVAVLAVALLLIWLAMWFIGVTVPGVVRGLTALGRRISVREVKTDG